MPTDFTNATLAQLQQALALADAGHTANRAFYDGDHWQAGAGWIGPRPPADSANYADTLTRIQAGFISRNAIRECVARHSGAVVGKEPAWRLTVRRALKPGKRPTVAEQKLIDEAEAALTVWWNERKVHEVLRKLADLCLLAERAPLRLFVPRGQLTDGKVPPASLDRSLLRLHVEVPHPAQATVVVDPETMDQVGIYAAAVAPLFGSATPTTQAEISYLDSQEPRRTVLRMLRQDDTATTAPPVLDLAEHLLHYAVQRPAYISPQVRQLQKLLNLGLTMLGRNVELGGFLERIILNGMPPGEWAEIDGERVFRPRPTQRGPGTVNYIAGIPTHDAQGKVEGFTSPSVVDRDPVEIANIVGTATAAYANILAELHQLHALISGDAAASGESRKQALHDFLMSLLVTKHYIEAAIRWLLETALYLAAAFAGQEGKYNALRADVQCRLYIGQLSAEEQRVVVEQAEKGAISWETAMSLLGVDDVAAEKAKIAEERAERQARAQAAQQPAAPAPDGDPTEQPQRLDPNRPPDDDPDEE